ncbi:MAG: GNAT family N-acetyltransferase [Paracoccaceae bacterium]
MATPLDANDMSNLLNHIIQTGGTTAHQTAFTNQRMQDHYINPENGIACVIAEVDQKIVGFQSIQWPNPNGADPDQLAQDWAIIATFVKQGMTGAGIGTALFSATKIIAQNAGAVAIDATIRADNVGGLRFYSKLGFVDYKTTETVPLTDGTPVNRISKRYDL